MSRRATRHIQLWLTPEQSRQLNQVLHLRGETCSGWVRSMVVQCLADRLPESQGGVKKVIPEDVARLAMATLEQHGDFLMQLAKHPDAPERQLYLRQEAGEYMDAAGWFSEVLAARRFREHLLETGQRQPRHRLKSSPSPQEAKNLHTTDAPRE